MSVFEISELFKVEDQAKVAMGPTCEKILLIEDVHCSSFFKLFCLR